MKLPKTLQNLFYNPDTDSISSLIAGIEEAHSKVLQYTDTSKGTVLSLQRDGVKGFEMPTKGVPEESFPSLVAKLFQGTPRWHSPRAMYNVAPPPVLPSVVAKTFTALYNPNLALDTASGKSLETEQAVVAAIAKYIGWGTQSGGIFTSGGKATILYGIKLGLRRCYPNSSAEGVKEDIVVLSTASGHPSHISNAEWLGIGSANVIRLATDGEGRVDLDVMERTIRQQVSDGKKIAAIVASGGTTNNMVVDPIEKIVALRDKLQAELHLEYSPHIHVDAVVAFPWIFFKDYDFKANPLNIDTEALSKIGTILKDLSGLPKADSFGIDFHKMGFCPYISSVFMVKDKTALTGGRDVSRWPFMYTLENSRSADGPNSAYVVLNALGVTGFQALIGHLTEVAIDLQHKIEKTGYFEIINRSGLGSSVMFVPNLPEVSTVSTEEKIQVRNAYTSRFVEEMAVLNNPYYIDRIPGDSTGGSAYPYTSLKTYIMSPYSSREANDDFVSYLVKLKEKIDHEFNFSKQVEAKEFAHPLKES